MSDLVACQSARAEAIQRRCGAETVWWSGVWSPLESRVDGVDDVEVVDVAFFEGEEEVAFGFGDGAAELEAVATLAGGRGDGGEGIGGVEDCRRCQ